MDPQKIYQEALALYHEGKAPQALQSLEALLKNHPGFEEAYEALSVIYSKLHRLDDAVETAKKWIRLNPHALMAHTNLSRFYLEKGMIAEAEHEQAEARRLSWAAELKQKKMKMPKADPLEKIERFKKVISLDPKDVLGYYSLGDAYLENGKAREAIESFSKGLEVDPQHSSSYYGLGQAYQAVGENEKAREVYLKGIQVAEARGDVMTQKKMEARLRQIK